MRSRVCLSMAAGALLALLAAGCGSQNACRVIPVQIELVKERRDAAMKELENGANQVDRMAATIEQSRQRVTDLEREKALLDSLSAVGH